MLQNANRAKHLRPDHDSDVCIALPHLTTKEKAVEISLNSLYLCRQRPTLPHTFACSNIGPAGLNFRVRDGNGWIPRGKITDKAKQLFGYWLLAFSYVMPAEELSLNSRAQRLQTFVSRLRPISRNPAKLSLELKAKSQEQNCKRT